MRKRHLLVASLILGLCIHPTPQTLAVQASQTSKQTSGFKVATTKSKASKYGYIKPVKPSYDINSKNTLKKATQLPTKFGSMNKTVRNQNPWGTCWAFAGIGNFEYAVDQKTGSDMDYSEEHMLLRLSKDGNTGYQITSKNTGGNEYMYSGYFASGMGPVMDDLFPYDTQNSLLQFSDSILQTPVTYRASNIEFFTTRDDENGALSSDTVHAVKQAIYENGSATCAITWNYSMIQEDGISYYNSEYASRNMTNHEVLIVGWDDDYSADHFEGVSKKGAWLIRNSWGSSIGDHGYFWVSYEDKSLIPSCSIKNYEEMDANDTIYNLDEGGALYPHVSYGGYSHVGFINSFSLKSQERLKEVTFYEAENGAKYQLFYIPVKEDGSLNIDNKQAITEKKTLEYSGYHTEKISKDIKAKKAAIMVMIDSNEEDAGFGAEGSISDGRTALYIPTLEKGQSYIYVDNDTIDLYDIGADFGNWSIKLVTEKEKIDSSKDQPTITEPKPATTETHPVTATKKKITSISGIKNVTYTGKAIKCKIVVKDGKTTLKENKQYKVSYKNNKNCGIATITITGIGDYKGSLTKTFKIAPKKGSIHNLKASKKSATVTIRKNEGNVTGYEISYSYKSNFKGAKIKNLKNPSYKKIKVKKKNYTITSCKLNNLTNKKYLYVKLRSYKQVGKIKVYGSFSSIKKVKIK